MDRRGFIERSAIGGMIGAAATAPWLARAAGNRQDPQESQKPAASDQAQGASSGAKRPPRLDLETVREFVAVSHGDLDKVTKMLEQEPRLVNATHDWGGGDFESALGAASHVGNRPIAIHLLENGARMNIFTAAMLGRLDIVRPMLEAYPELVHNPGPHGIPLVKHAYYGGYEARAVHRYIQQVLEANPPTEEGNDG